MSTALQTTENQTNQLSLVTPVVDSSSESLTPTNINNANSITSNNNKAVLVKVNKEKQTMENNQSNQILQLNGNKEVKIVPMIYIVASTVARIEQIYLLVQRNFVYKPNIELIINAIIETGRFDAQKVADNICDVFADKEPKKTRKSAIHLSQSNLDKCRVIQSQVKDLLEMDIDLHPVLNSMLYTGRFNAKDIASALSKLFNEKRKATLSQISNKIN